MSLPVRLVTFALLVSCRPETAAQPVDSCAPESDAGCASYTVDAEETHALPAAIPIPDHAVAIAVGDLTGSGGDQIYIGTDTTVTRLDGEGWASPTDIWSQPDDVGAVPLVADLTGDGVPDLLIGLPNSDRRVGQVLNLISPSTAGPFDTAAEAVVSVTDGPLASWADREACEVPVTVAWTGWPIAFQDAAWVGDLDGDGLADAILATGTQVEVLSSTAR